MSIAHIRPDGVQSVSFVKHNQQAVEAARQAAYQLLSQFETFFEDIFKYQVDQKHFKNSYEISALEISKYAPVKGPRYHGLHKLYSKDKNRIQSVEALNETGRVLGDLYDSIPDDYLGAWQTTIKKLDTLVLDKAVYQLVEEYLNTLPAKTRNKLREEAQKNMEACRQALLRLNAEGQHAPHANPLFEPFARLLCYEGIHSIYEGIQSIYTDTQRREKIAQAMQSVTQVLADIYETIPADYINTWQSALQKLDNTKLNESINTFTQQYLEAFPKETYGFLKEKAQTSIKACQQALEDLKEAHRTAPNPLFEFFTRLLTVGMQFFERLNVLLQEIMEKQNSSYLHRPNAASAA